MYRKIVLMYCKISLKRDYQKKVLLKNREML